MIRNFLERITFIHKQSWAERHFLLILIAAAVLFMVICLAIGLQQSVWFDEAYSIMVAKQPVDQLLHLTSIDTHPPLYYLLLKAWAFLFGWSELALRTLSVVAAGGAVVFGGLLIKRMFTTKAALMTLPFIVFAPFLLRYGFEIRMYALASFIGIAATYILVRALEVKDKRSRRLLYALYTVLVAVGVYTLYYTVVLWIAHLIWLVWITHRQKQRILKQPWLAAFAGSLLLFLPWLPTFITQIGNGALAPISQPLTINNLTGILSFMFVYEPSWQLSAALSLVVLLVIIIVTYFTVKAFQIVSSKQKIYLTLIGLYVIVPIAIIALVSLIRPMYVERYLAHVLIGGSLFTGVIVWAVLQKANKRTWVAAGALLVAMVIGVINLAQVGNYNFQRLQKPEVKQAAETIGECGQGKTILANDPYVAIELAYYKPQCDIRFYSEWPTLSGGYAPLSGSPLQVKDPIQELVSSRGIIYIHYDEKQLQLPSNLRQVSDRTFGPLHVVTFNEG